MEKVNTLILVIHPFWNYFFKFKATDELEFKKHLKSEHFKKQFERQMKFYYNTISKRLEENKNAKVIVFKAPKDLNTTNKHIINTYNPIIVDYNRLTKKYFSILSKEFNNRIYVNAWTPNHKNILTYIKLNPKEVNKKLDVFSFGEQLDRNTKKFCVEQWTERIIEDLKKHNIIPKLKYIEASSLAPKEKYHTKKTKKRFILRRQRLL